MGNIQSKDMFEKYKFRMKQSNEALHKKFMSRIQNKNEKQTRN